MHLSNVQTVSDEATHVAVITFDDTATILTGGFTADSASAAQQLETFT
jgi:hypothetical protein